MFRFRKHDNDIALAFHIGYDTQFRTLLMCMSFYKYEFTFKLGDWG